MEKGLVYGRYKSFVINHFVCLQELESRFNIDYYRKRVFSTELY